MNILMSLNQATHVSQKQNHQFDDPDKPTNVEQTWLSIFSIIKSSWTFALIFSLTIVKKMKTMLQTHFQKKTSKKKIFWKPQIFHIKIVPVFMREKNEKGQKTGRKKLKFLKSYNFQWVPKKR